MIASGADTDRRPTVRMSDYSPQMERLTDLVDRVGELTQVVIAVAGGKPKRLRGSPRPQTAIERARQRQRERKHRMVVARVLPGR